MKNHKPQSCNEGVEYIPDDLYTYGINRNANKSKSKENPILGELQDNSLSYEYSSNEELVEVSDGSGLDVANELKRKRELQQQRFFPTPATIFFTTPPIETFTTVPPITFSTTTFTTTIPTATFTTTTPVAISTMTTPSTTPTAPQGFPVGNSGPTEPSPFEPNGAGIYNNMPPDNPHASPYSGSLSAKISTLLTKMCSLFRYQGVKNRLRLLS